jgi:hypothetical protein
MKENTRKALRVADKLQDLIQQMKEEMKELEQLGYEDPYIMQELTGGYIGTMLKDRIDTLPDDIVAELEKD